MPLYRKLPHRGFNNYNHRVELPVVNVGEISSLPAAVTEVDVAALISHGLVRSGETKIKVLGDGEVTRAIKVTAAKFSDSAKAKIEKAGGQAILG
jgi:large subunit ribosomal protein L15